MSCSHQLCRQSVRNLRTRNKPKAPLLAPYRAKKRLSPDDLARSYRLGKLALTKLKPVFSILKLNTQHTAAHILIQVQYKVWQIHDFQISAKTDLVLNLNDRIRQQPGR